MQLTAEGDSVMDEPYEDYCDFWDDLDAYAEHWKTCLYYVWKTIGRLLVRQTKPDTNEL